MKIEEISELELYIRLLQSLNNKSYIDELDNLIKDLKYEFNIIAEKSQIISCNLDKNELTLQNNIY